MQTKCIHPMARNDRRWTSGIYHSRPLCSPSLRPFSCLPIVPCVPFRCQQTNKTCLFWTSIQVRELGPVIYLCLCNPRSPVCFFFFPGIQATSFCGVTRRWFPFFCFPHAKLFMRSAFLRQVFSIIATATVPQLSGCSSTATSNMTITTAGVPPVAFELLGSLKPPSRIQATWTSTARSVLGHSFNGLRMELPSEC